MNGNNMHPLTKAQSDFAAQNYELVFSFLSERQLDGDEFYDAAIFSYLLAVQVYDEHPELRNKPFSEVASHCMAKAVTRHMEKLNRRRTADVLHAYEVQNRQDNVIRLFHAA